MSVTGPISVVVPVYNDGENLVQAVKCLLDQSLAPDEIVVVDDGSTQGTARRVETLHPRVRYVYKDNGGPASARNVGIRLACGKFVAFTDSDCRPTHGWLAALIAAFERSDVAGVGGSVKGAAPGMTGEYVDIRRILDPKQEEDGTISYVVTANACFRREVLLEVGLFDERFRRPGGEELDLCRRVRSAGHALAYTPDAVVLHVHRQTLSRLLRTIANYGEGHYVLASIWPEYRVTHPLLGLCRGLIALHGLIRKVKRYVPDYGARKALIFGFIDYLYYPVFFLGYLRGRAAAGLR